MQADDGSPVVNILDKVIALSITAQNSTQLQGCQKQLAAGKNRCIHISFWMAIFKYNIPGLAAYFDDSDIYFKTF